MKEKRLRIYDVTLAEKIDELYASGEYESQNELLNYLLKIGIEEEVERRINQKGYISRSMERNEPSKDMVIVDEDTKRTVKYMYLTLDELFISVNIVKHLVCTLYNITLEELDGMVIDRPMIETGGLSLLPKHLQEIENKLIAKHNKEREKLQK